MVNATKEDIRYAEGQPLDILVEVKTLPDIPNGKTLELQDDDETMILVDVPAKPPVVPDEVTNYQLKQALNVDINDRLEVEVLVDASPDRNVRDGWKYASVFKKDNPLFQAAITELGWTQEKVDNLLILASTFD